MKKLNYLLHNVTVINFLVLWKLVLRYNFISNAAIFVFLGLVSYLYFTQPVVYQQESNFKILNSFSLSTADKTVEGLLEGHNLNQLMSGIQATISSYEFNLKIAETILRSPEFKKLDFRHPTQGNNSKSDWVEVCKDEECKRQALKSLVPLFYKVNYTASTARFTVTVTTRSAKTTKTILFAFQEALEKFRLGNASKEMTEQISKIQMLLTKSKEELEARGGYEKITSSEFLNARITQQKDKIKVLDNRLISDDNQIFFQKARLKESNRAAEGLIDGKEKLSHENYIKLSKRIDDLRQNIASINSMSPELQTSTDLLVLKQLKQEMEKHETELKAYGKQSTLTALDDSFINVHKGNKNKFEFDYKVSSAQVKKLRDEYDDAMKELDSLYLRKASLENELVALKPDLEYIQLLESKLVGLKYKLSAVSSDVSFEHPETDILVFKRNSLLKIIIFSFLFVGFILFLVYMIMYMLDDKIFEELEVQKCIDDVPIVGHAPYFE